MSLRFKAVLSILLSMLVIILGIGIGSVFIPPWEVAGIMAHKLFGVAPFEGITETEISIVWNLRTVRTLMAFVVGSALAVSGSTMQSVLQNPLASSYTLGVSSGASLGAGITMLLGLSFFSILTIPFVGMTCGILTVIVAVLFAAKLDRNMQNYTIVLVGMVISLFLNALITVLNASYRDNMQRLIYWQMGSFSGNQPIELFIITVLSAVGIFVLVTRSRELDMMSFGETQAFSMGLNVKQNKWLLLLVAAALTGSAMSFVGVIGFIDLIAPHVVRKMFGARHVWVLPMSALFGGIFMVVADIIARIVLNPIDLPVGAVTALIGAPFFMYIFFKKQRKR